MKWNAADDDLLKKLLTEGYSAAIVAPQLGRTRNAVLGRAFRLGLRFTDTITRRNAPGEYRRAYASRRAPMVKTHHRPKQNNRPATVQKIHRVKPKLEQALQSIVTFKEPNIDKMVTLLELEAGMCRWPMWGDDATRKFYCGEDSFQGMSYCAYHCKIGFQPYVKQVRSSNRLNL